MKLPHPFVMKLSLATVLAVSAGLSWATPEATAGKIDPLAPTISFQAVGGNVSDNFVRFGLQPNPFVAAIVHFAPNGVVSVAGIAAEYGFIVNGPHAANLDLTVKVDYEFDNLISDAAKQSDDTSVGVHTSLTFDKPTPALLQQDFDGFANQLPALDQEVKETFEIDSVAPRIAHLVGMFADIGFSDRLDNPLAIGVAIVDPVITFAPGFDSTGFSLEFAPGVGNEPDSGGGTATPEPSTLFLSSIAFGMWGIVWAYRQWKRTIAAGLRNGKCVALLVLAVMLGYANAANAGTAWHVGDLTTYGQGIWGGVPGTDPGATLLVAKFDTVYASTGGVIVGSTSGSTMVFTDANSLLTYMPSVGSYAPLNGSVLNPITTASGAFGGDVLALEFNVDFSDAGFLPGTSGLRFGDLILTDFSTFPQLNGLTVRQILGDMNTLLSGGSSIVSISDLGTLVGDLNVSFSSGLIATQFAQDHLVAPSGPAVPEPSSLVLWGSGLLGLAAIRRWKRRHGGDQRRARR